MDSPPFNTQQQVDVCVSPSRAYPLVKGTSPGYPTHHPPEFLAHTLDGVVGLPPGYGLVYLSLIHISEPTRRTPISYAVFCLKKKKKKKKVTKQQTYEKIKKHKKNTQIQYI